MQQAFDLGFDKRPQEELYDLSVDPSYMRNVASDSKYSKKRKELHNQLMSVLREQRDPRLIEEVCRFESAPFAGPTEDHKKPGYLRFS